MLQVGDGCVLRMQIETAVAPGLKSARIAENIPAVNEVKVPHFAVGLTDLAIRDQRLEIEPYGQNL